LASGDLLLAFDEATNALAAGHRDRRLRYLQVLALARMEETARARRLYEDHLAGNDDDLDIMALHARLLKDDGLRAGDPGMLRQASALYAAVFDKTGAAFPAVNAATLAFLAGDRRRADEFARATIEALGPGQVPTHYYDAATAAEAHLLLGDAGAAETALSLAMTLPGSDLGARSSTSRQLQRIVEASAGLRDVTDRLRPPPVLTYCGHMLVADPSREAELSARIDAELDKLGSRIAFGALACGADILIAERLLARGGQINVVLPFLPEDFVRTSVASGGEAWVPRFEACLARANEVVVASATHDIGDDRQYEYCSMLMMGYARLRANHLGTSALQLAIWDEVEMAGPAGTSADVRLWRGRGGRTIVLPFKRAGLPRPAAAGPARSVSVPRAVRAMIFTDFAGFSRIDEAALPEFWEAVIGTAASVIERFGDDVCARNTWGDALFVVTRSASAAARLALALQQALVPARGQFGEGAGMRISAHLGAVYEAIDPVTGRPTFFGREVNRTARIEPITSVGEVYVTRAFAAVLEMDEPGSFEFSYVGRVPLAKEFGEESMYRLSPVPAP
jgi:hypothetical protein